MKHLMNRWLLLFILILGMSGLACNLPFGGEEEAVEVEEDSSFANNVFPETLIVQDTVQRLDTLQSYEMEMEISTTVSDTTQVIQASILVSNNPTQSYITVSGFEPVAGINSVSVTQIDGIAYLPSAIFGCDTMTEDEFSLDFFGYGIQDATELLEGLEEATLVGEESINGIETVHYIFDETAIGQEMSQFNWAQGDIFIAKEGNYVVRFQIEGEAIVENLAVAVVGESDEGVEQLDLVQTSQVSHLEIEINVGSVNEPVNIVIPEECETTIFPNLSIRF